MADKFLTLTSGGVLQESNVGPSDIGSGSGEIIKVETYHPTAGSYGQSTSPVAPFTFLSSLNLPLDAGTYLIDVHYIWALDSSVSDVIVEFFEDAVEVEPQHQQEPADDLGSYATQPSVGTNQRHLTARREVVTYATAGNHSFEVKIRPLLSGNVATVFRANMVITKV
jgi:hypothetical protein